MSDTELTVSFQRMLENPEISPNEQVFIENYTEHLNKSAAWRASFPDYALDYGRINALLDKPSVKEQISIRLQKNLDGEISRSPAMLLKLVERVTNLQISEFYDEDGTAKSLNDISPDLQTLITGVNFSINNKNGERYVTYTLLSKEKAIDRLLDVVKLLVESRKVVGNEFADEVGEAARMRDQIFNDDPTNARPVNEEPKARDGRGTRAWTEEQKAEARERGRKRWEEKKKKKNSVDDGAGK
jgi:hypothetical protein